MSVLATKPLVILSLGAGVQSSTLALMAAKGEIPCPDMAIFADTGYEPKAVYAWLEWLEARLPFPVCRVSGGNLKDDILGGLAKEPRNIPALPFFSEQGGMSKRECTADYKIKPINRKCRELGATAKNPALMLIGISLDEAARMKPSRVRYIVASWPLIDRRMTRLDCLRWMERQGYPQPPKSSCVCCPFHNAAMWRDMKIAAPDEFADACQLDDAIRQGGSKHRERQYLHSSRKPLREVDLRNAEDRGQVNLFVNECEGMCGV